MSLKDIKIMRYYETRNGSDVVNKFYIPALGESKYYDRIAGFFTSSSIAISFKGIQKIIESDGKIRMLVSPILSKTDVELLNGIYDDDIVSKSIERFNFNTKNSILNRYQELFAWLLVTGRLEIKLVMLKDKDASFMNQEQVEKSGIFHQKVGIFKDSCGNVLTFSGSINETASAWFKNSEEFKTFKSWDINQREICEVDIKKFEDIWNLKRNDLVVKELPVAIKEKYYLISPKNINESLSNINDFLRKLNHTQSISLFFYQKNALELWKKNNKQLLFEMATGTGKTRTAIACIEHSLKNNKRKVIIIATPEVTLTKQWITKINRLLDYNGKQYLVATGTDNWLNIEKEFYKIKRETTDTMMIFTTHTSCSKNKFINLMKHMSSANFDFIFVGDEVHKMGSPMYRRGLLNIYQERIGLSATPSRWFDDEGTKLLIDYFNNDSFKFEISDALQTINPITNKTYLTKYNYYPIGNKLDKFEEEEYLELTKIITKNMWKKNIKEHSKSLQILFSKRSDIIKNAKSKIDNLENLLVKRIGLDNVNNLLIFVSPQQMNDVTKLLCKLKIQHAIFTQDTGKISKPEFGNKSEREHVINCFKKGLISALVAIKCLDEGIDIPVADKAILMASTTNPREYVQRIGRVIRQHENKVSSEIYDFFVQSHTEILSINDKEKDRIMYIAKNAINVHEAYRLYTCKES